MVTAEELAGFAGVVLSLVLSYAPGVNGWYAGLNPEKKRLLMLGLLVLVSGAAFGLACTGMGADFGIAVTCDRAGGIGLLRAFLLAVIANQSAFLISPEPVNVRRAVNTARFGA